MRGLAIAARSRRGRIAGWTLAAILALAAATVYGLALWRAPSWAHATTPQGGYNARVLVISVGGAIVVGAGLLYTARNYRLSRRGQVTDRFTIALERLGSSELYVRIGGVHALGGWCFSRAAVRQVRRSFRENWCSCRTSSRGGR